MNARLLLALLLAGSTAISHASLALPARARPQDQAPLFSARSDLVILHAVVTTGNGAFVTGLTREAFQIFEDGERQTIQFFGREDAPVTVGLIIDSSGSMGPVRGRVIAAAGLFARMSHAEDEFFGLLFNDFVSPALPVHTPFTADAGVLQAALGTIPAYGRTAMHDAVSDGLDYAARGSHERKVLIVVSDGGDNASKTSFEQVLRKAQVTNTVIYTIAITDPVDRTANPGRLKQLAEASGGRAFRPRTDAQLPAVFEQVAREVRNTYLIGYSPTNTARDGRFRRVRITAESQGGDDLEVRTRIGYVMEDDR
jgi:VWFA-related protein